MVRDLRLRARLAGDRNLLWQEEQKRNGWMWENALRRHNFVGFIGEVLKGVTRAELKADTYDRWVQGAKATTKKRLEEKRKGAGASMKEIDA